MTDNHQEELEEFIDSGKQITVMTNNGMKLTGTVKWQDKDFINLMGTIEGTKRRCTIGKSSLICYYEHREEDERFATIKDI